MAAHGSTEALRASFGLLMASDTRTPDDDVAGATARRMIEAAGHRVFDYRIVPDEVDRIRPVIHDWLSQAECDAVLVSGGTGIAARDRTFEAVVRLLDKRLDGFGEMFRMLSWEQVASKAMLSRAVGGISRGKPLFALPGSPAAVELALERLILPEINHLLGELRK